VTTDGRARARDLGIVPGSLPTGELNAITDVAGVRVGHTTLIEGSDIRTGVTAIVHDELTGRQGLAAGLAVGNGYGKIVGTTQVAELGVIETPIVLTGTLSVFRAADALVSYMLSLPGNEELATVNPVVAETNDGFLSDVRRRPISAEHVLSALRGAAPGPVTEGAVGAGTGTRALGFKAGIGTSSRIADRGTGQPATVGVLVQANFGGTLTVLGVPVPPEAADQDATSQDPRPAEDLRAAEDPRPAQDRRPAQDLRAAQDLDDLGSCVIVLATDAPLDSRQLTRLAWRCIFAMGRVGSGFSGHSGDYALAFTTAGPAAGLAGREPAMNPLFAAAMDATEEAILNSLLAARTTSGIHGHVSYAVELDRVLQHCRARGVLAAGH
jgi:D-aminopeptidase